MSTRILRKNEVYFDFADVKKKRSNFELTKDHVLFMLKDLKISPEECLAIEMHFTGAYVKFNCRELFKYLLNVPIYFQYFPKKSYRIDARHEIVVKVDGLPLNISWDVVKNALSRWGTVYNVEFEFFEPRAEGEVLRKTGSRLVRMELRKSIALCPIMFCGHECEISYPGQSKGLLTVPPVQRAWFVVEGWKPNTCMAHVRNQCIKKVGTSDVRVEPLFKQETRSHRKFLAFKVCVRVAYLQQAMQQHVWPNLKIRMFVEKPVKKTSVSPPASSPSSSSRRDESPTISLFLF